MCTCAKCAHSVVKRSVLVSVHRLRMCEHNPVWDICVLMYITLHTLMYTTLYTCVLECVG